MLAVALVAVFALSSAAALLQPPRQVANGGQVIGQTTFAYLGGLRRFAAAVLWNRIDPQYDTYYANKSLADMTFMLPTIRMVQSLDPQFEQTYYVAAWIIARRGDRQGGIDIARDGVAANPRAGLMYANLIQLLTYDAVARHDTTLHVADEVKLAQRALALNVVWASDSDRFEGYAVFREAFSKAGMKAQAAAMQAELERMSSSGVTPNASDQTGPKGGK